MTSSYAWTVMGLGAGVALIMAFGVPATMWLIHRTWPQTPKQLERDAAIRKARSRHKPPFKLPF